MTMRPIPARSGRWWQVLTPAAELVLTALGLAVVFGPTALGPLFLGGWTLFAALYVVVGGFRVRRAVIRDEVWNPAYVVSPLARRFRAVAPLMSSLIGLGAAVSILFSGEPRPADAIALNLLGALAMILAWLLLHASYAQRYQVGYRDRGGLEFPGTPDPAFVDFLYFALTLGTSFATSDVDVTNRRTRWHVLVHSILGFFYNAIVLAVAFKVLTGG